MRKDSVPQGAHERLLDVQWKDLSHPFCARNSAPPDIMLLFTILALAVFGTVMVSSAGISYAQFRYSDAGYFIKRQSVFLILGVGVMFLFSRISPDTVKALTVPLYFLTLVLLILVLLIGFTGNGAQRWIRIGPLTVQPSEIAKLALILMLAKYFSAYEEKALERKNKRIIFFYGTVFPILLMLSLILPVMLQKHLSCIIILGTIGLLVTIGSGVHTRYIRLFTLMGIGAVTALALFTDYTKERITVWLNPEAYRLSGGWQTLQGLMAIGSGGIFGRGLGQSVLKHCYISEPANDMIFTVLCEELGWTGAVGVLLLFGFLVFRATRIAVRTRDTFSRTVAFGITVKVAVQTLLNIAVVTNTIPNTGISLPFFSYGGSSLVMLFAEMGILLSVSRRAHIEK